MIYLYYFTGTGNSLYMAKELAKGLRSSQEVALQPIAKDMKLQQPLEDDQIGIIYPTYFLDAPDIIYDFIDQLRLKVSNYVFLLASCGGMIGNALHYPAKRLRDKGHDNVGVFETTLPDNSIIFPTPKEKEQGLLDGTDAYLKQVLEQLQTQETSKTNLSIRHAGLGKTIRKVTYHYHGFTRMKTDDTCTGCGVCAKVCANQNIEMHEEKPVFHEECLMCFACIHYCPNKSVTFKRMKSSMRDRYQNPYVSVKELAESRRQKEAVTL